ncbi:hypothetical protein Q5R05_03445 [Leuconostoc carnosum]|uniref:hypothetical protein n=1 Tax=Leuconostoc carnosum TaxID=1252 RepID=UPI00272EC940|nr:hypothetical protein [Leuconostoc carnosum]WLC98437.1 hypothetical protein Q5R05_03445 [Leuconostoc carnosum]
MQFYDIKVLQKRYDTAKKQQEQMKAEIVQLQNQTEKADDIYRCQQQKVLTKSIAQLENIISQLHRQLLSAQKLSKKANTHHFSRSNTHRNDL